MTLSIFLGVVSFPLLVLAGVSRVARDIEVVEDRNLVFRPGSPDGKQDCNLRCPSTVDYHCGTNGVTYASSCHLLNANCKNNNIKLAYKGSCDRSKVIPPSSCPKTWTCIGQYSPVCGTNDRTYDNSCYLTIANCRDTSIRFKHYGSCEDGTGRCILQRCNHVPTQYVCASDNNIYRNLCELRNARCSNINLVQVACPTADRPIRRKCADVCPLDYDPKCGSNGKSYINQCHIDLHICRDPRISMVHDGSCVTSDITEVSRCKLCSGREPEEYVCGSDGVSYRTLCDFNYALCMQPCPKSLLLKEIGKCKCGEDCTFDMSDPVCGSDGRSYESTCEFRVAACNNPGIKLQATGMCKFRRT